jgi:hypothetical protein
VNGTSEAAEGGGGGWEERSQDEHTARAHPRASAVGAQGAFERQLDEENEKLEGYAGLDDDHLISSQDPDIDDDTSDTAFAERCAMSSATVSYASWLTDGLAELTGYRAGAVQARILGGEGGRRRRRRTGGGLRPG